VAVSEATCSHGDPTCPCPDGLACHYEGDDAMRCPSMPNAPLGGHCHVEGCRWETSESGERCGLLSLPVPKDEHTDWVVRAMGDPICGAARFLRAAIA
jgi:hypothetical protein